MASITSTSTEKRKASENGHSTEIALPIKPFHAMTNQEKKAFRYGNRKRFAGFGYALVSFGGTGLITGLDTLNGNSLHHIAHQVAGFEIVSTAIFILVIGLYHIGRLIPWEDA